MTILWLDDDEGGLDVERESLFYFLLNCILGLEQFIEQDDARYYAGGRLWVYCFFFIINVIIIYIYTLLGFDAK